ncbi:bifunctional diguanylate cyclase/phosphodiesterase [Psychrobacillus sp. INOP01]|uniref:sensor domain-containing protein n=1 Tax=Psychrobacillus sp. INOP01 TaxID=2829187 RepID=UPI001BA92323|nr:bifunctional diguanylate cyclase/phosphodiesterase [Psychrobacillus sp. INOP01]QUG40393.1 bifunctional diguanylate cyclase/phosphodiesterase [Psychrobacillus sp. INOP01]
MGTVHPFTKTILSTSEDLIIVLDDTGKILNKNNAWKKMKQTNEYTLLMTENSSFIDLLESTHNYEQLDSIQKVLRGEIDEFQQEFTGSVEENHYCYLFRIYKLRLSSNRIGAIIIYSVYKKHAVANSEVTSILESMTDAFFSVDKHWNVTYINEYGKTLLSNVHPSFNYSNSESPSLIETEFYPFLQQVMLEKKTQQQEIYIPSIPTWFEVKAYPRAEGGLSVFFHHIAERKNIEKDLRSFAYYDFLTNLPNRRMTYDILQNKIKNDDPFSFFYIELNGFKLINDMYGHARGDALLVDIANFFNQIIQVDKVVARVGGDEFAIFTDEVNKEQLSIIANKLIQEFQQTSESMSVPSIPLSLCIGISRYPEDAPDTDLLFRYANLAMYASKKRNDKNFSFFERSMIVELERNVNIENELHGDLKETSIHFVVQPQFNSITNAVIGIEVLTRWIHPKYGYITPPEFIEIADNSGRIEELTKYLISEVFSKVARWIRDYGFDKPVAINITPKLLGNRKFFNDLIHFIQYYRIPPQMIDIEITENANLNTDQSILDNIAFCRKHGIRLSLDDFGTGYSKLADLVDFQIDKLKIDKYFVDKIGKETNAELILHTFMNLAKGLKCDVLAEGVETKEQVDYLNSLGLTYFQGYYFSKPISLDEFEQSYLQSN